MRTVREGILTFSPTLSPNGKLQPGFLELLRAKSWYAQFFPWIHIGDLAGILTLALEANHVQGVLNGVAPASTTTNAEFAQSLGAVLGRPAFIPLPSPVVQAVFGKERAIMLLEGQKVVPRRTLAAGYKYSFPELRAALQEIVA